MSAASNPKFEVRDRAADAERYCVGNNIYFVGKREDV